MADWQIPPHTFDALYRYYRHSIPTGGFLAAVIKNDAINAARSADATNAPALRDIILFNYKAHAYRQDCIADQDFVGVDFTWDKWRRLYSPSATPILYKESESEFEDA
jgi:hypothetical protein